MDTLSKLSVIKTLHQTDIRLYELLEMREYPTAIQLLLECRQALQVVTRYIAVWLSIFIKNLKEAYFLPFIRSKAILQTDQTTDSILIT